MTAPRGAALPGPLVSAAWLAEHPDDVRAGDVRVVDVRWYLDGRSGADAYVAGHLPGAVWLDIDTDLAAPATQQDGRHPLPTPDDFAAALGRVGIAAGTPVVAYDDAGGSVAARLWWLLRSLGEPAAVLDGGLAAWDGPLTREVPAVVPVHREPRPWPAARFAHADDVARAVAAGGAVFDARTAERYAAGLDGLDPRPGHVPGARSAPWAGNLGPDGRFRAATELRERFAAAGGAASGGPAIAYCGSGVTACHDLLAMDIAGIRDTALYPGSWSQWGADPSRPTETGAA